MDFSNNIAKLDWNEQEGRYELRLLNKLKAYSHKDAIDQDDTKETHATGKKDLIKLAKEKGYVVIEG